MFSMLSKLREYRNIVFLLVASSIGAFPWGYMSILQSIYLAIIGFSTEQIGFLFTVSGLTGAILTIPFGMVADKVGKKKMLVLSNLLFIGEFVIYYSVINYLYFVVASILGGLSFATFSSPWTALFADELEGKDKEKFYSISASLSSIIFTAGSFMAVVPDVLTTKYFFETIDAYRVMFFVGVLAGIVSLLFVIPVYDPHTASGEKKSLVPRKSFGMILRFGIPAALVGFGAGFIIPLFSLWFYLRFGLGGLVLGPLFGVSNLLISIAYLIAPLVSRKIGPVYTIVVSEGLATLLLILIPFINNFIVVAVLYIFRNLLMNVTNPIQTALLMDLVASDERASANSMIQAFWDVPNSTSPYFGGYLMKNVSLSLPFFVCGFFYGLSVILFFNLFKSYNKLSVNARLSPSKLSESSSEIEINRKFE